MPNVSNIEKFKCKTARSWPAFYVKHKNKITEMLDVAAFMKARTVSTGP